MALKPSKSAGSAANVIQTIGARKAHPGIQPVVPPAAPPASAPIEIKIEPAAEASAEIAIVKPDDITPEAWAIANGWSKSNLSDEQVQAMLAVMPAEMVDQIKKALAAFTGEPITIEPTEPFYAEPTMVCPDGALVLDKREVGGTTVALVRYSAQATGEIEAGAWRELHKPSPASPAEVAAYLAEEGGMEVAEAWQLVAALLADAGTEEVIYPLVSEPTVPEGTEPDETELGVWRQWMTSDQSGEAREEAVAALVENGGEESDLADATAVFADLVKWGFENCVVLPQREEPELAEGTTIEPAERAAWEMIQAGEHAKAMTALMCGKTDAGTMAAAAQRMAQLVAIPAKVEQYELTIELIKELAGIGEKAPVAAKPIAPGAPTNTAATGAPALPQIYAHLALEQTGGFKDILTEWLLGLSGAKDLEGFCVWIAGQPVDLLKDKEVPGVKPQRQPKAKEFFFVLKKAVAAKHPAAPKPAELPKVAEPPAAPVNPEIEKAIAAEKAKWDGMDVPALQAVCKEAEVEFKPEDGKPELIAALEKRFRVFYTETFSVPPPTA